MNHFFQKYSGGGLGDARDALNHSYDAKLAVKVSDLSMRRIISQDYTTRYKTVDEDGNYVPATEETKDEGL